MNVFLITLGGLAIAALVFSLCIVAATLQAEMCSRCPFKKVCDAHQNDENFTPKCDRHRTMTSHNTMNNSL